MDSVHCHKYLTTSSNTNIHLYIFSQRVSFIAEKWTCHLFMKNKSIYACMTYHLHCYLSPQYLDWKKCTQQGLTCNRESTVTIQNIYHTNQYIFISFTFVLLLLIKILSSYQYADIYALHINYKPVSNVFDSSRSNRFSWHDDWQFFILRTSSLSYCGRMRWHW